MDDGYHVIYMDESETKLTQDEVRKMLHKMDAQNYHGKPKVIILAKKHLGPIAIHLDSHTTCTTALNCVMGQYSAIFMNLVHLPENFE